MINKLKYINMYVINVFKMQEFWFPKEILKIIKGYEYSLIDYEEKKTDIINSIKFNLLQPYYMSNSKLRHKTDEGQLDFVFSVLYKPQWDIYFSKSYITELVINYNRECRESIS